MASGPTLPPQAYTREILTAAFNWLQTQPESVKKLATTPDALVGLYSRAKRFGNSSLESDAPVSSQNFMSDLKHLAEGLKQFEEPAPIPRPQQRQSTPSHAPQTHVPLSGPVHGNQMAHDGMTGSLAGVLNDRGWAMIQEVKSQLNLSSDAETVNMMVSVAYKSFRNLLT